MTTPLTFPKLKQRLEALISTASVSAVSPQWDMGNRAVIDLLADWYQQLGFSTRIQELTPGKANLIATYGSGPGGLVLSGHTDTVPFNEERWQFDPLKISDSDNRFYGLGTSDMKSFFALIIEAVLPLLENNFKAPLIILATADEESSMSGAQALSAASIPAARAAIIGEPTSLKPIRMHKGMMMNALEVTGQSGHSSDPSLGRSALEAMHDMITELKTYRNELQQQHNSPDFAVQFPTLNLGCIHGGDNPNRICNSCELHFDFRAVPGVDNDEVRSEILKRLKPIADAHEVTLDFSELFGGVNAFEQASDSELVQLAEKLTGHSAEAVAFATEAPYLQKLGMQTIVMGPGSIDQAHQPDEYIAHDQINPSIALLRQFIGHYCL